MVSNPFRIVSSTAQEEEQALALRPETLAEFVGQERLRERLEIAIEAASQRNEPIDHILFSGPAGVGKTSLAKIVANEMGSNFHSTSGPALKKTVDLFGLLNRLKPNDFLFVDEVHALPRIVEEYLYTAMEDFSVDVLVDDGHDSYGASTVAFPLQHFTLVGATTRKGLLSSPLRDRFGLSFELDFYTDNELTRIARRSASILDIDLSLEAGQELARRSRGTPRITNRLVKRVRDYAQVKNQSDVDQDIVRKALDLEGVDSAGLDELDRRYLHALIVKYEGRPVGVQALAATMQQEVNTLEETVEPYLLYANFLLRTQHGRQATDKARKHLRLIK